MTVRELIRALQALPAEAADLPVFYDYDDGYGQIDVKCVEVTTGMKPRRGEPGYKGKETKAPPCVLLSHD